MDPDTEAAQRVGTTLCNKWTLERLIGTGGMAAVYVASHKIGRREAIKILHSDVARDPEVRARFEQEADAVNRFKHPGTVEVRDIDVAEDGSPFMVMELLDGQPLAELARRPEGVALGDLLRWVDELLDVLAAAHAMGIIHRDIKPDNLFVQRDGRLKVLDFGIARVRAGAQTKLHTRVGATLGTAPYMPPEQIRGVEIDARADLFAVGATMFRLIARRRVHEAPSEAEMLVMMASQQAPPLASVAPAAPAGACLVVDRALMFDRALRYADAPTMQGDVRALREGRAPPYATAQAPGFLALTPNPSDAITQDAPTRTTRASSGSEALPSSEAVTAVSPSAPAAVARVSADADPATRPAMMVLGAAGLGAPLSSPASVTKPAISSSAETPVIADSPTVAAAPSAPAQHRGDVDGASAGIADPATRPAMMVLGAAGLGAPLSPARPAAPDPALAPTAPQSVEAHAAVPLAPAPPAPPASSVGERTLRSHLGPELAGVAVAPQGYVVATTVMPAVHTPLPTSGPRTQVQGTAPPPPASVPAPASRLAPGESIPVIVAPPPPRRRVTLPGTDIRVLPLIAVGVVFAAIGVGITLWFTLGGFDVPFVSPSPPPAAPSPSAVATGDGDLDLGHSGAHPGLHATSTRPAAPHPTTKAHPAPKGR